MLRSLPVIIISTLALAGCSKKLFYLHPLNGVVPLYKPAVVARDSIKSAFHLTGSLSFGRANEDEIDRTFCFNGSLSRSHVFKHVGFRYGGNLVAGSYKVNMIEPEEYGSTVDPDYINSNSGRYSFGSYGVDAGVHYIVRIGNSEWRLFGVEASVNKEFGDYLSFRQRMPASAATLIDRDPLVAAGGFYTEIVSTTSKDRIGIKLGSGRIFGKTDIEDFSEQRFIEDLNFQYVVFGISYTRDKWSGIFQGGSCARAYSLQIGASYRLGK